MLNGLHTLVENELTVDVGLSIFKTAKLFLTLMMLFGFLFHRYSVILEDYTFK